MAVEPIAGIRALRREFVDGGDRSPELRDVERSERPRGAPGEPDHAVPVLVELDGDALQGRLPPVTRLERDLQPTGPQQQFLVGGIAVQLVDESFPPALLFES